MGKIIEDKVKDGFHLQFRPQTWEEVRGNEHTVKSLREMLSNRANLIPIFFLDQQVAEKQLLLVLLPKNSDATVLNFLR